MAHPEKAVLLLSGGMDSTALLWWMRHQGIVTIHTVAIDYGQRHRIELEASSRLSELAGAAAHKVIALDLTQIGGSPLTSDAIDVPAAGADQQVVTVVPFRNALFVTAAAAYAETVGISNLYISPVADDYAAYRDCRREFYDAMEASLSLGATQDTRVHIQTPFVEKSKIEVVSEGIRLRVPYELTHTCYEGTQPACGRCDACTERIDAFKANSLTDPIPYAIPIDWST
ncbi:TPA: 7-cyano-7-deazaguanine synthase QueC [Candidatus Latescibacteria bacterium]|nr:7-cyano-7-deazaguanine synthase QueC [Candidatus Latescibacterota bacterium]